MFIGICSRSQVSVNRTIGPLVLIGPQMIPAKSHANISLSFTPFLTDEVSEDVDCNGFMLGFLVQKSWSEVGQFYHNFPINIIQSGF